MGFVKRLGWYLVGLSIGIIFLAFFLKKKSAETGSEFCYFPNCRVLKDIRSKTFAKNDDLNDTISFERLDEEIKQILENGTVDFKRSDTKSSPCKTYFVEGKNTTITLKIKNCPNKAVLEEVLVKK